MMLLGLQGSCNCKSWKTYKMIPTRMQGFTKKRPRVFMTEWLQERSFMLETKSFFTVHIWNFFWKLRSRWIGCFVISNVFPYSTVEITSLETNKVPKIFVILLYSDFAFSFLYLFTFRLLLYGCHSLIFLFFYFNIEDNVVFKMWGYLENLGFLCCFHVKKIFMFVFHLKY